MSTSNDERRLTNALVEVRKVLQRECVCRCTCDPQCVKCGLEAVEKTLLHLALKLGERAEGLR